MLPTCYACPQLNTTLGGQSNKQRRANSSDFHHARRWTRSPHPWRAPALGGLYSARILLDWHSGHTGVAVAFLRRGPLGEELAHPSFGEAVTPVTLVLRSHLFGEARSGGNSIIPASARSAPRLRWCCGRISSAKPARGSSLIPASARLALRLRWCHGRMSSARPARGGTRSSQLRRCRHSGHAGVAVSLVAQ